MINGHGTAPVALSRLQQSLPLPEKVTPTRKSAPLPENLSFYRENFHSSLEEYSLYE